MMIRSRGDNSRGSSSQPARTRGSGSASPSQNPALRSPTVQVQCPHCRQLLIPPENAPVFRCPCGTLLKQQADPDTPSSQSQQESRLVCICPSCRTPLFVPDSRSFRCVCGQLLETTRTTRLPPQNFPPRRPDGSLNVDMLTQFMEQMSVAERGASAELIGCLPTHTYIPRTKEKENKDSSSTGTSTKSSQDDDPQVQCIVCLSEYEAGDELRTLPCLHYFHKDCIDPWLKRNKLCPVCKTPIDVGVEYSPM